MAQETEETQEAAPAEIVVTAQKRSERLQDVRVMSDRVLTRLLGVGGEQRAFEGRRVIIERPLSRARVGELDEAQTAKLVEAILKALPKADAGIYVPMALALTFPFNLVVGIPLYHAMATQAFALTGGLGS